MLLIIDNYDSFTYNLVQYFGQLGVKPQVYQNDQLSLAELIIKKPAKLVISPGPRTPDQAGLSISAIQYFADKIPILGVCLGHQCLAQAFGGKIQRANQPMHGKTSLVYHDCQGVFSQLKQGLVVGRYHSLVIDPTTLPEVFLISAWSQNEQGIDEIMGIRHKDRPLEGVQFHPESILTETGLQLCENFLRQ